MPHAKITALNIYPVKSCRGIALDRAVITPTGFQFDRRWMIIDEKSRFQTQRELPRLAVIHTQLDGDRLRLSAHGMPDLDVVDPAQGERMKVKVWDDECKAISAGEDAAQWLSRFMGKELRLVSFDPSARRIVEPEWTGDVEATAMFSDAYPFLVLSEASLAHLNTRLSRPLPMNRFRPNIVLSGLQAHDEDRIQELYAGNVRIRLAKPCARCAIPTTDQATGMRHGEEPLRTLKSYRWDAKLRGVMFGQNGILLRGAQEALRVGQEMEILWK